MDGNVDGLLSECWRGRIDRQSRSGLTIGKFCVEEGVSTASFYQWRRRLKCTEDRGRPVPGVKPGFVELSGPGWCETPLRITLPGGAVVDLPTQASAELITVVIHAAKSILPESRPC
jgi:hypothetical protein